MSINELFFLLLLLASVFALRYGSSMDWIGSGLFGLLGSGMFYYLLGEADLLPLAVAR